MKTFLASGVLLGISLLCSLNVLPAQAQSGQQGSLSGRLYDGQTQEPIPHANVVLLRASDNRYVKTIETDAHGYFKAAKLPLGQYKVRTTVLGYQAINPTVAFYGRQTRVALGYVVMLPLSAPRVKPAYRIAWARRSQPVTELELRRPAVRVRS
jgi:hypothetical protein